MMNEIKKALRDAARVVILPHINPDWDTIGSSFALAEHLRSLGKEATVVTEDTPADILQFLGGEWTVRGEFTPVSPYTAVAVDSGAEDMLGERLSLFTGAEKRIVIDHHGTNSGFGDYCYVDPNAAAVGEILTDLLLDDGPVSPSIASFLYTAILTDTGGFRFTNTTPHTMRTAARLMEAGADSAGICIQIFENQPLLAMRITARAIDKLQLLHGGKTALIVFDPQDMEELGACSEDTDNLSGLGRSIDGVEVSVSAKPQRGGYKVSLRSKYYVDVAAIAKGFGGGGHPRAAGFFVPGEFSSVQRILLAAVETELRKGGRA